MMPTDDDSAKDMFDLLYDTPAEAEEMRVRALMIELIIDRIEQLEWTAADVSEHFEIPTEAVTRLYTAKFAAFSLEELIGMGIIVGVHLRPEIR